MHLQKLSPATHTHTLRASCQTASLAHLFKTPNTFAHIATDVCFHQPTQGGFVEQSGIQMSDNPCRMMRGVCVCVCVCVCGSDDAPVSLGSLTDCLPALTAVGAGVAPPTDYPRGFLPLLNNLLHPQKCHWSSQLVPIHNTGVMKQKLSHCPPRTVLCEYHCLCRSGKLANGWSPDSAPPWPNNFVLFLSSSHINTTSSLQHFQLLPA